jgi:DNA-binding beta-propeller fold protein YncE
MSPQFLLTNIRCRFNHTMISRFLFLVLLFVSCEGIGQGFYNHIWLTGNNPFAGFPNGRITFDSTGYIHVPEMRKMSFKGTEATICDAQGNFLMSTNGIWVANANNDTMLNGGGLNPNFYANSWAFGMPLTYNTVFIPSPGDTNKYYLFHHSFDQDTVGYLAYEMLYSVIDINGDGGLGEVVSKNNVFISDSLNQGFAACKHSNGRDWWIMTQKNVSNIIFTSLLTPNGIDTTFIQVLNSPVFYYNVTQMTFSSAGDEFALYRYEPFLKDETVVLSSFDRCTGMLSNTRLIPVTINEYLWGLAFSPSGQQLYVCSSNRIYQIDTDSLTIDTVATYDGFISPPGQSCCATSFWNMYLAANGKIYITSGSSVQHLHEMNYPDSAGVACDVQQHALDLGSYLHLRAVPNHPNYNLGPVVGSICDTLSVGLAEPAHDFRFSISPNPVSDGVVKLTYILPQNKAGVLEVFDLTGQRVCSQQLPPWSTLQFVQLPELSNGLYTCVIRSGNEKTAKKLVLMR